MQNIVFYYHNAIINTKCFVVDRGGVIYGYCSLLLQSNNLIQKFFKGIN